MDNPREPFVRLLDVFDKAFQRAASRHGFVFDPGIHQVTRAIRKDDGIKRGVFLDLRKHWMESDPVDPMVMLTYGAWSPSHFLVKRVYDGRLTDLVECIDRELERAIAELLLVSEETINRQGISLDDLKNGRVAYDPAA